MVTDAGVQVGGRAGWVSDGGGGNTVNSPALAVAVPANSLPQLPTAARICPELRPLLTQPPPAVGVRPERV